MEETSAVQINEEDELGDDFYERMEAPKFVDFTAPDHYHPDDSYWFCLRVGCDKKHEEELDIEAINKNFVLRVMAARSPNVRLRKALNRKESSANVKCPLTAPAKSSKSRMYRLAVISSTSHKVIDNKWKAGLVAKTSSIVTPNAKMKKPFLVAKALTTPRNPKRILNPDKFSSVQNHKPTSVIVPKNKVVAKSLVFHSPKRVKTKYSAELKTPVKKLCSVMKKLEITGGEKNLAVCNQQLHRASSRKQLRGREVKSRVFDSLNSHGSKGREGKSSRCLGEEKIVKGSTRLPQCLPPSKEIENDFSDMEVDGKSINGSLGRGTEYVYPQKCNEHSIETSMKSVDLSVREASTEISSDPLWVDDTSLTSAVASDFSKCQSMAEGGNKASGESDKTEEAFCSLISSEAIADDDKENAPASDDKENFCEVNENKDKENASARNDERKLNLKKKCVKIVTPIKDDCSRITQKKSASTTIGSQVVKYRKPRPTNPKPFKLRTDERGILREANTEKKLLTPSTKIKTAPFLKRRQTPRKRHEKREDHDNHIGKSKNNAVVPTGCKDRMEVKEQRDQTESKISRRRAVSEGKSQIQMGICQEKNVEHNLGRRKSPEVEPKFANPRRDASTKKEKTPLRTRSQLIVTEESSSNVSGPVEAASLCENEVLREIRPTSATSRPSSRGKMPSTIPKEPCFHSIHVPRSCTRKMT